MGPLPEGGSPVFAVLHVDGFGSGSGGYMSQRRPKHAGAFPRLQQPSANQSSSDRAALWGSHLARLGIPLSLDSISVSVFGGGRMALAPRAGLSYIDFALKFGITVLRSGQYGALFRPIKTYSSIN